MDHGVYTHESTSMTDRAMGQNKITICTDSQGAIKATASNKIISALVLECWESLKEMSSSNETELVWVSTLIFREMKQRRELSVQ